MGEFRLTIGTDNSAFSGDDYGPELARILRKIAQRLDDAGSIPDGIDGTVSDSNGNRCGYYSADMHDADMYDEEL